MMSVAHSSSNGVAEGPLSPPTMTQSMPDGLVSAHVSGHEGRDVVARFGFARGVIVEYHHVAIVERSDESGFAIQLGAQFGILERFSTAGSNGLLRAIGADQARGFDAVCAMRMAGVVVHWLSLVVLFGCW